MNQFIFIGFYKKKKKRNCNVCFRELEVLSYIFFVFFFYLLYLWLSFVGEQFRAVVHQLRQRKPAVLLQQTHLQVGAAGIHQGEDFLAEHCFHGKFSLGCPSELTFELFFFFRSASLYKISELVSMVMFFDVLCTSQQQFFVSCRPHSGRNICGTELVHFRLMIPSDLVQNYAINLIIIIILCQ